MSSGVIDVDINPSLPDGIKQLSDLHKNGMMQGVIDPFNCRLVDQTGKVHSEGGRSLEPQELMNMDWLMENVEGSIPAFEELLPVSQQLVRLLGLHRNSIQPKPEEVIL